MTVQANLKTRLTASIVAIALLAPIAILAGASPAGAATPPYAANGGALDWGVKASFVNYIEHLAPNGSVTVTGGASRNDDGTFHFPVASNSTYDPTTGAVTTSFAGAVQFTAHGGLLDLQITGVQVNATPTSGQLVADVVSTAMPTDDEPDPEPVTYTDLVVADLGAFALSTANPVAFADVPALLTEAAVPAFSDFYDVGEALDPVDLSLHLADDVLPAEGLTWRVSSQLFTSSSLAGAHPLSAAPTVKVAGAGDVVGGNVVNGAFVLPEAEGVSFTEATGAFSAAFPGDIVVGNVAQGGYRVRFSDLEVTLDGEGRGQIVADVAYALCFEADGTTPATNCPLVPTPGAPAPASNVAVWAPTVADVVVADFPVSSLTVTCNQVTFTGTPDFILRTDIDREDGDTSNDTWRQFPQGVLDAVAPASPSLLGHFRETATGQVAKAPSPVTVSVPYRNRTTTQCYVDNVYRNLLGRPADGVGLAGWSTAVQNQGPSQFIRTLLRSGESTGVIVDALYNQYLGRPADGPGRRAWAAALAGGAVIEDIERGFLNSVEASNGRTDAQYVTYLYEVLLRRTPAQGELNAWVAALGNGATRPALVNGILLSAESARARVRLTYEAFLGRQPDPTGLAGWAQAFQTTGSRLTLFEGLLASNEYRGLAQRFLPAGPRLPIAFPSVV